MAAEEGDCVRGRLIGCFTSAAACRLRKISGALLRGGERALFRVLGVFRVGGLKTRCYS